MHGKLRQSDIHRIHRNLRVGNISKRGTARNVGAVDKCLPRNASPVTEIFEDCRRDCVCTVLLVCVVFDHDSFIQKRMVDRVCLVCIIWMECMGIVCGDHKAVCKRHQIFLVSPAKPAVDTEKCVFEECRCRSLFRAASDFFIIKDAVHRNAVLLLCTQKALQRREGTLQVVQSPTGCEFVFCAPYGAFHAVVQKEIMTQDIFFFYTKLCTEKFLQGYLRSSHTE